MLRFLKKQAAELSDAELLQRYKSTEQLTYLAQLFGRYIELTYGSSLKYLKDPVAAEDAVMNIFEELIEKTKKHEIKQFRGWLHVLTRNHCLGILRKQQKNLTVSFEPQLMQSEFVEHPDYELTEEPDKINLLKTCVEGLIALQKKCVEQFYYGNKSYKEIAEEMAKPVGTIRSQIQNGRRNLKICMEKKSKQEMK